jgi:hypothetical protein
MPKVYLGDMPRLYLADITGLYLVDTPWFEYLMDGHPVVYIYMVDTMCA